MNQAERQLVRQMFAEQGLSVADWAREHGFSLPLVYAVLKGRNRASRGESFRIAVALGLRPAPQDQSLFQMRALACNPLEPIKPNRQPAAGQGVAV